MRSYMSEVEESASTAVTGPEVDSIFLPRTDNKTARLIAILFS